MVVRQIGLDLGSWNLGKPIWDPLLSPGLNSGQSHMTAHREFHMAPAKQCWLGWSSTSLINSIYMTGPLSRRLVYIIVRYHSLPFIYNTWSKLLLLLLLLLMFPLFLLLPAILCSSLYVFGSWGCYLRLCVENDHFHNRNNLVQIVPQGSGHKVLLLWKCGKGHFQHLN